MSSGKLDQNQSLPLIPLPITLPASCSQEQLLHLNFLKQEEKQNVLLLGGVGTGKTHLAIALGIKACRQGFTVRFFTTTELITVLRKKHKEGRIGQFREELAKCDCIILDELGYVPYDKTGSELLFHVISDCYEKQSVIVTSNMEIGEWASIFGEDIRLTSVGGPSCASCSYIKVYGWELPVASLIKSHYTK